MDTLKLKDNYQVNMLYQHFKNQSLPQMDRFYLAKIFFEQILSSILILQTSTFQYYLNLSVLIASNKVKTFIDRELSSCDFETIILLNSRIESNQNYQEEDENLLTRIDDLINILLNISNSNYNSSEVNPIEYNIKQEISSILNKMDTFVDNENAIEKLELEIHDLESILSFNNNLKIKSKIDLLFSELYHLKSYDRSFNQIRLDELQLKLLSENSLLPNNDPIKNDDMAHHVSSKDYSDDDLLIGCSELNRKYPEISFLKNTMIFDDFMASYNNQDYNDLEKKLNKTRYIYLQRFNLPSYIFKQNIIQNLLFYLPENDIELLKVKGIGDVICYNIGQEIISYINEALRNNETIKNHKVRLYSIVNKKKISSQIPVGSKYVNSYTSWTKEEEELLIDLFENGYSIKIIADKLLRIEGSIRSRLNKLGYKVI